MAVNVKVNPKQLVSILSNLGQGLKYATGFSKYKTAEAKQAAQAAKAATEGVTDKLGYIEKRIKAGLTTPQAYNPFVSEKVGRVSIPRTLIYGGVPSIVGLSLLNRGKGQTNTSGLTDAEMAKYLNYQNDLLAQEKLKNQLFGTSDMSSYRNFMSQLASDYKPYSVGASGVENLGSPSAAYVTESSLATPYSTTETGSTAAANQLAGQIGSAYDTYAGSLQSKNAGKGYNQEVMNAINAAAAIASIQQRAQAEQDYRKFLLDQISSGGQNPYLAPKFTGTEQGLSDVYTKWNSMSPAEKEALAQNQGIYSPYDYYVSLKRQNPEQYPGG